MLAKPLGVETYAIYSASTPLTTTGTTQFFLPRNDVHSVTFFAQVTSITGTVTLDVYIQTTPDGGTTWWDCVHFNQFTTSASSATASFVTVAADYGGIQYVTGTNLTQTTGAVGAPLMDRLIRAYAVLGGSTPQAALTLNALLPNTDRSS